MALGDYASQGRTAAERPLCANWGPRAFFNEPAAGGRGAVTLETLREALLNADSAPASSCRVPALENTRERALLPLLGRGRKGFKNVEGCYPRNVACATAAGAGGPDARCK